MREDCGGKQLLAMGEWSLAQKLRLVRDYLGAGKGFLAATSGAGERYYVDLFAGPGQGFSVDQPQVVVDGSPLISLQAGPPYFTHLHWVEQDPVFAESLRVHQGEHPHRRVSVYEGDANERVDDVLAALPRTFPIFAFLDPRGPELAWETVAKLARHKQAGWPKVELLILFAHDMAITRLLPHDATKMVNEQLLDRFMPDPTEWRRIYVQRSSLTPGAFRLRMLEEYVRGLKTLGYQYVLPPYLVRRPDNHPLYFLIFASDHPAGGKIMSWCLNHLPDIRRQPSLFPYDQEY
jgi:three-Cys-motif partner protein